MGGRWIGRLLCFLDGFKHEVIPFHIYASDDVEGMSFGLESISKTFRLNI